MLVWHMGTLVVWRILWLTACRCMWIQAHVATHPHVVSIFVQYFCGVILCCWPCYWSSVVVCFAVYNNAVILKVAGWLDHLRVALHRLGCVTVSSQCHSVYTYYNSIAIAKHSIEFRSVTDTRTETASTLPCSPLDVQEIGMVIVGS